MYGADPRLNVFFGSSSGCRSVICQEVDKPLTQRLHAFYPWKGRRGKNGTPRFHSSRFAMQEAWREASARLQAILKQKNTTFTSSSEPRFFEFSQIFVRPVQWCPFFAKILKTLKHYAEEESSFFAKRKRNRDLESERVGRGQTKDFQDRCGVGRNPL